MSSTRRERELRLQIVKPSLARLPGYVAALERDWSPDNARGREATLEQLAQVADNPRAFVARLTDREAKGPPVKLPDGSSAKRIAGYQLWLWDDAFCGAIGFRWQPGTSALPPHVLGHIGYAVVPWKQGRGYATAALRLMLRRVRNEGLRYVEITTDPQNTASQKVVLAMAACWSSASTSPHNTAARTGCATGSRFEPAAGLRVADPRGILHGLRKPPRAKTRTARFPKAPTIDKDGQ